MPGIIQSYPPQGISLITQPAASAAAIAAVTPAPNGSQCPDVWRAYFYLWSKFSDQNIGKISWRDGEPIPQGFIVYNSADENLCYQVHGFAILPDQDQDALRHLATLIDTYDAQVREHLQEMRRVGYGGAVSDFPFYQSAYDARTAANKQFLAAVSGYNYGPLAKVTADWQAWWNSASWQAELTKFQDARNTLTLIPFIGSVINLGDGLNGPRFKLFQTAFKYGWIVETAIGTVIGGPVLGPIIGAASGAIGGSVIGGIGILQDIGAQGNNIQNTLNNIEAPKTPLPTILPTPPALVKTFAPPKAAGTPGWVELVGLYFFKNLFS